MKKYFSVALSLFLLLARPAAAERINLQFSVVAGTPIRIATQSTSVNRLFIQSRHGSTGIVYLLGGVPTGTTCNANNSSQLTAELGPGDSLHPGASLSDPQGADGNTPSDREDLATWCIDGSHTGDLVIVSFWRKN